MQCWSQLKELNAIDTVEIISLNNQFRNLRTKEPFKAFNSAHAALELAKKINYAAGQATAYNNLGVYEKQKGNYDQALSYYQKSLHLYDSLQRTEGIAKALSNIGNIYSLNQDFENALKYYLRAQQIFESLKDTGRSMQIKNNIANVYAEKGQDKIALKYYFEVLDLYKKINDESFPLDPYSNIGKIYFQQQQFDSAFYYFNRSLQKEEAAENKFGIASALVRIARLQNKRENYLQALDASLTASIIAESVGSKPIMMESYSTLAEVYLQLNDLKNSYIYLNRYHQIKDSLYNENTQTAIAELEKNIELEQKEKEIALLKKEAKINALENRNNELYTFGTSLMFILLGSLAIVTYSRFRNSRKAKILLERQNHEILNSKKKLEIQKQKLENWNQNITDSIEYAK
ncbi:MAG: tetratricopeptide repeat protein, partial [Nitrososphaeraceae archaeon]|nr:tetratricopeptide repeat protein [Nitrososphaeraceae archaeon]